MVIKVIVIILLLWLFCTLCFTLGLFFASAKLGSRYKEESLCNKHLYEVHCRFGQSNGFDKVITIFANNEYDAIGKALNKKFKYNNIEYSVYSIIKIRKLDKLEEDYYA